MDNLEDLIKGIILIGISGTGKREIGRAPAERTECPAADVNDLIGRGIAAPLGMIIRQICREREPLYVRYADLIVTSCDGEDDTAQRVETIIRTVGIQL